MGRVGKVGRMLVQTHIAPYTPSPELNNASAEALLRCRALDDAATVTAELPVMAPLSLLPPQPMVL